MSRSKINPKPAGGGQAGESRGRFSAPRKAQAVLRLLKGEALEPIRQGVREQFGGFTQGIADGLAIRHDHGSQYLSDDFQGELTFLGMRSSPSFVREPEGNGCAERFIRTLKENLLWVRTFKTIEELRLALLEFKKTYNEQWIIQRHGYKTPSQVRQEKRPCPKQAAGSPRPPKRSKPTATSGG